MFQLSFTGSLIFLSLFASIAKCQVNVAAYYYPWHTDGFHHNQSYLREKLNQRPQLGEYDDRDPDVIRQHISWSERGNINVWITSWFGPESLTDETLLSSVLPTIEKSSMKFALLYESVDRLRLNNQPFTNRTSEDMRYICENYFSHKNYYKINDRPVLFIYATRVIARIGNMLDETISNFRKIASASGFKIYLVGDHAFGPSPTSSSKAFHSLDAITNYDVYGRLGRYYVGEQELQKFYRNQNRWKVRAAIQDCAFMPSVTPGFNDRGVRLDKNHEPLSRKLTKDGTEGSFFKLSLQLAKKQVDDNADNLLVVTSFNEWHEDTQIEPVVGKTSKVPHMYTLGIEYEGYGTLYLDILRAVTKDLDLFSSRAPMAQKPSPTKSVITKVPTSKRKVTRSPGFKPTRNPVQKPRSNQRKISSTVDTAWMPFTRKENIPNPHYNRLLSFS
jgi:glycoprotein endo-alpha-1,2-mannosidase